MALLCRLLWHNYRGIRFIWPNPEGVIIECRRCGKVAFDSMGEGYVKGPVEDS